MWNLLFIYFLLVPPPKPQRTSINKVTFLINIPSFLCTTTAELRCCYYLSKWLYVMFFTATVASLIFYASFSPIRWKTSATDGGFFKNNCNAPSSPEMFIKMTSNSYSQMPSDLKVMLTDVPSLGCAVRLWWCLEHLAHRTAHIRTETHSEGRVQFLKFRPQSCTVNRILMRPVRSQRVRCKLSLPLHLFCIKSFRLSGHRSLNTHPRHVQVQLEHRNI